MMRGTAALSGRLGSKREQGVARKGQMRHIAPFNAHRCVACVSVCICACAYVHVRAPGAAVSLRLRHMHCPTLLHGRTAICHGPERRQAIGWCVVAIIRTLL